MSKDDNDDNDWVTAPIIRFNVPNEFGEIFAKDTIIEELNDNGSITETDDALWYKHQLESLSNAERNLLYQNDPCQQVQKSDEEIADNVRWFELGASFNPQNCEFELSYVVDKEGNITYDSLSMMPKKTDGDGDKEGSNDN